MHVGFFYFFFPFWRFGEQKGQPGVDSETAKPLAMMPLRVQADHHGTRGRSDETFTSFAPLGRQGTEMRRSTDRLLK